APCYSMKRATAARLHLPEFRDTSRMTLRQRRAVRIPIWKLKSMRKLGLFLIVLLAAATPASATSEVFPGSGPIGTTVTISGEGFGKFMSVRENAVLFGSALGLIE